jgi:acetyl-CoA carboxylase biotin carboxyl carrier protein
MSVPSAAWLDEVSRMLEHVLASDASEVEVAAEGFRLRLVRKPGRAVASTPAGLGATVDSGVRGSDGTPLVAPLTGVFYRAASPDTPPLVSVGDRVEAGAVVGLIETMKIFNEVLAEQGGRIATVLAESGQLVHAGDVLMTIEDIAEAVGEQAEL